jgi:hypothetical protein
MKTPSDGGTLVSRDSLATQTSREPLSRVGREFSELAKLNLMPLLS